ncbi:MAG TPA: glycosyltransferase [Candidatus Acidoferrum sp.]|nr:glycosyltransferase [Candidatus Acidoferrum sp.]
MVLAYHEIVPSSAPYLYAITRQQLKEHLHVLATATAAAPPPQPLPLTFDDGHLSQYAEAAPLLEQFSMTGAFFITAGWVGKSQHHMTVAHLRDLSSRGHQIQAHGWSHRVLTLCSPAILFEELARCKSALEDWLGLPVTAISMPHGRWNDRVLSVCAAVGFKTVFVSDPRMAGSMRNGVRVIGRTMVTRNMSGQDLRAMLSGAYHTAFAAAIKANAKALLKRAIGDRRYHALWNAVFNRGQIATLDGFSAPSPAECEDQLPNRPAVLQLISSGGYYGAENVVVTLAKALHNANLKSVIGVFENSQNPHLEIADHARALGLTVEIIPCDGRVHWNAVRTVRDLIYKHGISVVHAHGSKANVYAAAAARGLKVSLVATYHLDWPDRGFLLFCYHALDRVVLRRYDRVVAVSQAIARSLRRSGLTPVIVPNGIDLSPFVNASERGAAPRQFPGVLNIGVVARLTPQKGHTFLLDAAPEILAAYPQARFVFVGDGPTKDTLQSRAAALGLSESVIFAGVRRDMPAVYAGLDIVVLPSVNEGMPMTLIEALAAGKPVVATSVGEVPALIRSGETGILVKPRSPEALRDAIIQLISDPDKRLALGMQGRAWVSDRFTSEAMAGAYRSIYEEALTTSSRAAGL